MSRSFRRHAGGVWNGWDKTDKRLAAKAVRKYRGDVPRGNWYRKLYDTLGRDCIMFWWEPWIEQDGDDFLNRWYWHLKRK